MAEEEDIGEKVPVFCKFVKECYIHDASTDKDGSFIKTITNHASHLVSPLGLLASGTIKKLEHQKRQISGRFHASSLTYTLSLFILISQILFSPDPTPTVNRPSPTHRKPKREKGKKVAMAGSRTRVSRVTGGDNHRYTTTTGSESYQLGIPSGETMGTIAGCLIL